MKLRNIVVIAHNMRSINNVGSLLRTAEGLGVSKVYLTGYTPHPKYLGDPRLPHIALKQTKDITKTALGANETLNWEYVEDVAMVIDNLKSADYKVVGLEQSDNSTALPRFEVPDKVVLILGEEVAGIAEDIMKLCDQFIEIPMFGSKESFNVVQAAAMAMYHCRFL